MRWYFTWGKVGSTQRGVNVVHFLYATYFFEFLSVNEQSTGSGVQFCCALEIGVTKSRQFANAHDITLDFTFSLGNPSYDTLLNNEQET